MEGVSKRYGGVNALVNANLTVEAGVFTACSARTAPANPPS